MNSPLSTTTQALRLTVQDTVVLLRQLSPADAVKRPAPGKWSRQEIIGHLVDSAVNNIPRFVRLQKNEEHITGLTYEQDFWVNTQQYQLEDWPALITLWASLNMHIAHILDQVPAATLEKVMTFDRRDPATLHFLATDYVDHLQHHLQSIFLKSTI